MGQQTVSFELTNDSLRTIDEIAAHLGADRQTVFSEALAMYLADYEQLNADLEQADREIEAGETIPHEDVVAWLNAQHPQAKDAEAA